MKIVRKSVSILIFTTCVSCHSAKNADEEVIEVKTPVTVTTIEHTSISESSNLNASSTYQKKNQVKSTITGFIENVFVSIGDHVKSGMPLFTIKTKEAEALSGFHMLDSTFKVKGVITITSPATGVIVSVDKQLKDYVNDGEQVVVIAEQSSFVFLMNVPFEFNKYASIGKACNIILPDQISIPGIITTKLSTIDIISQTQLFVVKPKTDAFLPEGLLASVKLIKNTRANTQVLDKACILSDEAMQNFWVMKLINDSTAVKISVKKGMVTEDRVEIVSPQFSEDDKIINSGNYALPDTAFVKIIQLY